MTSWACFAQETVEVLPEENNEIEQGAFAEPYDEDENLFEDDVFVAKEDKPAGKPSRLTSALYRFVTNRKLDGRDDL